MFLLTRLVPKLLRSTTLSISAPSAPLIPATVSVSEAVSSTSPLGFFGQSIRTVIRVHFPRPSERKRIKRHGYKARMAIASGRRVLMNKILKGKFVISH